MKLFKLKRKNIIFVSLLAIAGFLGISSVAVNHTVKDTPVAEEAEAVTNSVKIAGSFTSWSTVSMTKGASYYYYDRVFALNDTFKVVVNDSDWVSANWKGISLISGIVDAGDSDNHNFKISTAGGYRIKAVLNIGDYGDKGYGVSFEVINVNVTKYVVKDGVKEADAVGTDTVQKGTTYQVPSSPGGRSGFSFEGWFTNEACTTSYTATTISSNKDLYAKYNPVNFTEGKRYYLSLDSNYTNWEQNNAWFAVYLVSPNDTSATWVTLTKLGTSHFYYFDMPSGSYNKLVFVRMDSAATTPSFDESWNQSSDIYKDGDKDYWLMNSGQWGDVNIGASGVWYTTTDNNYRMFDAQLSPTPSSMRYWFTFKSGGGTDAGQFFNSNARLGIHAYNSNTGEDHYYLTTPYQNSSTGDTHYFYYVDIPITVDSLQLIRVASGSDSCGRIQIWNFPSGSILVSSYLPSEYWLIDFSFSSSTAVFGLTANADKPGGNYWRISAWAMSEVLKAYYTCSASELNGYGAAANLRSNFWDHPFDGNGDFNASTPEGNPWIYDYTYADYIAHGGSYSGCTRSNSYGMNCTNKWNALATAESRYSLGAWNSFPIFNLMGGENNFSTIIIIVSSSVALLSVTALSILVIRKRKSKED